MGGKKIKRVWITLAITDFCVFWDLSEPYVGIEKRPFEPVSVPACFEYRTFWLDMNVFAGWTFWERPKGEKVSEIGLEIRFIGWK